MNEIESCLISALICDNSRWLDVRERISADDFTDHNCIEIFREIERCDGICDISIIRDRLDKRGLKDISKTLLDISSWGIPTLIDSYTDTIKDDSRRRKVKSVMESAIGSDGSVDDTIKHVESEFISLYETKHRGFRDSAEISRDYVQRMVEIAKTGKDISGLTTGFRILDKALDGLHDGSLIIIGARPSIGKTSLMVSIADHLAVDRGKVVAVFSIESPEVELFHKFVSQRANIGTKKLRTGTIDLFDRERFDKAITDYSKARLSINDVSTIDILSMRAQIRKLMARGFHPDCVFVDYLQIMDVEKGYENFAKKIGKVAQGLKNIAKELNRPVVVCTQVNRNNLESAPRLLDLKDSGDIEAIADVVLLLHRDEFYKKDECPLEQKGKLQVDVAKNRNGRTMVIELNWNGEYTKITEPYTGEQA